MTHHAHITPPPHPPLRGGSRKLWERSGLAVNASIRRSAGETAGGRSQEGSWAWDWGEPRLDYLGGVYTHLHPPCPPGWLPNSHFLFFNSQRLTFCFELIVNFL